MKISAALMTLTALTLPTPIWAGAGDYLPEPTSRRVILHGVDCSISTGAVCDEERPVFDEAIENVPSTAVVAIQTEVLDGRCGTLGNELPSASADAVRDYFIGASIAAEPVEQVEVEGYPGFVDRPVPVVVQLSSSCN